MQWLDQLIQKWNRMMDVVRPYYDILADACHRIARTLANLWKYIYMFRGIILAAPLAAAAVIIASISMNRLPDTVSLIGFRVDTTDPDALLGFLSTFTNTVSREVAVFAPLMVSAASILMMIFSKRTLFPFFVTVMTLFLPLFIWFYNAYPV